VKRFLLLGFVFFFLILTPVVFAQEATPTLPPGQAWAQKSEIYTPRLLPTSPFYFLKTWKEKLELVFTANAEQRVAKRIELATRRLAEMKAILETHPEMTERIAQRYQNQIRAIAEEGKEIGEKNRERLMEHISQMTLKHQEVLLRVYDQAPGAAKKGLENALENSLKGHLQAVESISKERKGAVLEELGEKQEEVIEKVDRVKKGVGPQVREQIGILREIRRRFKGSKGERPESE